MMLASPWTPSGPLSECPGANLNHFFYSKQLGHLQKRGYNLACLACVLNIYINGVHQRQSMEWVSMIMNVSFQIGLLLGAPWMSVLTLSTHSHTPWPITLQSFSQVLVICSWPNSSNAVRHWLEVLKHSSNSCGGAGKGRWISQLHTMGLAGKRQFDPKFLSSHLSLSLANL